MYVTCSNKRGLKSILSLLRCWHCKKVYKTQFSWTFESSPYGKRYNRYGQWLCGSQVDDVVIVLHFFCLLLVSAPQRLKTSFVGAGHRLEVKTCLLHLGIDPPPFKMGDHLNSCGESVQAIKPIELLAAAFVKRQGLQ